MECIFTMKAMKGIGEVVLGCGTRDRSLRLIWRGTPRAPLAGRCMPGRLHPPWLEG